MFPKDDLYFFLQLKGEYLMVAILELAHHAWEFGDRLTLLSLKLPWIHLVPPKA